MSVRDALEADLEQMPAAVQSSTLAAVARNLADVLDEGCGARDSAAVAKEMRAALTDLRAMADAAPEEADPIDDLSRRRVDRITDPPLPGRSAGGGVHLG
ncbi:hypothetical protein FHR83_007025 [Actinoplanes campanulatus]|uniref:Uncharacterized protein n=1 Tax=Actinoplanes campanulatus TaxID=113559 RepID=A0A7W5ANX4_9ACTN|nr:hypothetical protein [Actinoplanes campanulatus]MBB3099319.1 hypothetical protein [Actinoplanes campanulatus]GGN40496.1 hypothetical protein GCM10010109_69660 [Actinoplanes campanulatus]GID40637.1 hypothetical protein Aca09nite_71430 [Actinoplanes campanulatus]